MERKRNNWKKTAIMLFLVAVISAVAFFAMGCGANDNGGITPNQESGVDEGDIFRISDGKIIKLQSDGLTVSDTAGGLRLTKTAKKNDISPKEIITYENYLIVFYDALKDEKGDYSNILTIEFYDMLAPTFEPLRTTTAIGAFVSCRIFKDNLYIQADVARDASYIQHDDSDPYYDHSGGTKQKLQIKDSAQGVIENESYGVVETVFLKLDLKKMGEYTVNWFGYGDHQIYFSPDGIFVINKVCVGNRGCGMRTYRENIIRLNVDTLENEARTDQESSQIISRYHMLYRDGYLIVARQGRGKGGKTTPMLVVYGEDLKEISRVSRFADGEQIKAVSFDGDYCYIVTFRQVDPLFKIDISNPMFPKIVGSLKIDGFSANLIPYSDTRMIGVGVGQGDGGSYLKVTLFDVSGDTPKEINTINFVKFAANVNSLSRKNVFTDNENGIVVAPIDFERIDGNLVPNNGAVLISVKDDVLSYKGMISHERLVDFVPGNGGKQNKTYFKLTRFARIGDSLFAMSDAFITAYNLSDMSLVDTLDTRLAEITVNFFDLDPETTRYIPSIAQAYASISIKIGGSISEVPLPEDKTEILYLRDANTHISNFTRYEPKEILTTHFHITTNYLVKFTTTQNT